LFLLLFDSLLLSLSFFLTSCISTEQKHRHDSVTPVIVNGRIFSK
jgi:hypothetical protein